MRILFYVIVLCLLWIVIIFNIICVLYSTSRIRYIYEENLWNKVKEKCIYKYRSSCKVLFYIYIYCVKFCFIKTKFNKKRVNFVVKKSIIKKRFYRISEYVYINPLKELISKNVYITKKTIYNHFKYAKGITNKELLYESKKYKLDSLSMQHFGEVNGINFYNQKDMDIFLYSHYTKGDSHPILLKESLEKDIADKEISNDILASIKDMDIKIPTLKVGLHVNDLTLVNKSLIKTFIPKDLSLSIKESDIFNVDINKMFEIKLKEQKVIEFLGIRDYELINKDYQLYFVPKTAIKSFGYLIEKIDFSKAEKVTYEKAIELGYRIANIKELHDYLNVTDELKKTYIQNYDEYFKYYKMLKKG